MKTWKVEVHLHAFLTLAINGQHHTLATLPPGKSLYYPLDRRLLELSLVAKDKSPTSLRIIPSLPICWAVTELSELTQH